MISFDKKNGVIVFDNNGKKIEKSIYNGSCKLQWKVDWAMRWFAFDVDFEMYGKDLTESAILSSKVCKVLGKVPRVDLPMSYSLMRKVRKFLNQKEMV